MLEPTVAAVLKVFSMNVTVTVDSRLIYIEDIMKCIKWGDLTPVMALASLELQAPINNTHTFLRFWRTIMCITSPHSLKLNAEK